MMSDNKIIALIDMDCFYVQVEQRIDSNLKGKPCAVVQYNAWKGGGIIAVSYEARANGVSRNMRGDEAKENCPSIELIRVPEVRGKADLTRYRDAGAEVIDVLTQFSSCVERASIDEAFVDITKEVDSACSLPSPLDSSMSDHLLAKTFLAGAKPGDPDDDARSPLANWLSTDVGADAGLTFHKCRYVEAARLVQRMRTAVEEITGFQCSAGIAPNKMLSKLVCGIHKPNKQTILPPCAITSLLSTIPINKIRNLGGKFGNYVIQKLNVDKIGELTRFSELELQTYFGYKSGAWLFDLCRGINNEPVKPRQLPQSVGCSKNFTGKLALDTRTKVKHWLQQLAEEIVERLIKDRDTNGRIARSMTVGVQIGPTANLSRVCALVRYDPAKIVADALALLREFNTAPAIQDTWSPSITSLRMIASKFQDKEASRNIESMLMNDSVNSSRVFTAIVASSSLHQTTQKEDVGQEPNKITSFFKRLTADNQEQSSSLLEEGSSPLLQDDNSNSLPFFERLLAESTDNSLDDIPVTIAATFRNSESPIFSSVTSKVDVKTQRSAVPSTSKSIISPLIMETVYPTDFCDQSSIPASSKLSDSTMKPHCLIDSVLDSNASIVYDKSDYIKCSDCGENILVWSMPEHSDFHMARSMEQAWKEESICETDLSNKPAGRGTHSNLKRRKGRPPKHEYIGSKEKKPSVTLDNYFSNS